MKEIKGVTFLIIPLFIWGIIRFIGYYNTLSDNNQEGVIGTTIFIYTILNAGALVIHFAHYDVQKNYNYFEAILKYKSSIVNIILFIAILPWLVWLVMEITAFMNKYFTIRFK